MFRLKLIFIASFCTALSACWIPEEFDAKVTINNDGSYVVSYEGSLASMPVLMNMSDNKGKLTKTDSKFLEVEKEVKILGGMTGMKKAEYIGDGRVRVSFERKLDAGQTFYFLNKDNRIVAVERLADGGIRAGGTSIKPDDLKVLQSLKAKFGGTFKVTVGNELKLFYTNATSKPGMFGGAYSWEVKKPTSIPPGIIVYPKSVAIPTLVEGDICAARREGGGWIVSKYRKNDGSTAMFPKVNPDGSFVTCVPKNDKPN